MKVRFDTHEFEFSHGRKPRGRGAWAFFFSFGDDAANAFWANGSFAEAKKAAAVEARRRGVDTVFVGS